MSMSINRQKCINLSAVQFTDYEIAQMIIKESKIATTTDNMIQKIYIPNEINKKFLQNTVRSVDNHNRREVYLN
jgi:hypothetical protein